MNNDDQKEKKCTYYVSGIHCPSCEILIENKTAEINGVKSSKLNSSEKKITITYDGKMPNKEDLNNIFMKDGYSFSEEKNSKKNNPIFPIIILGLFIITFLIVRNNGALSSMSVTPKSSLISFLILGLLAGVSSCAALVGGLILSISKKWLEIYQDEGRAFAKMTPHIIFNFGRLLSYAFFGAVIGFVGERLQFSTIGTSFLMFAVSLIMIILAMQMLGFNYFNKIKISWPKFISKNISNKKNLNGKYSPFLIGALTFFLPCGFTITAQSMALISGSAILGSLIMLFFALGTMPSLLLIGISASKLTDNKDTANKFSKIAGILILFLAVYNINAGLNAMGKNSLSNLNIRSNKKIEYPQKDETTKIVNNEQIIKMEASSSKYSPSYFKIKVGVPVVWEVKDIGVSGCTNAIIAKDLFEGEFRLKIGGTSTKEFIPQKTGKYKFSCWMGMVSGVIEVVE
ncbi:hypothetical protein CVU82_01805 [Candidatus Falkowbacteria bacterium HGW-Falkowbacteria-1]|jgi:sulfite exporter TauE/SafE/copper chaperone CopZ|uniref:HMA domain-containing protein n=1 Tax=Candidatus Falkowbacteria bacterium HGW-Falkowbacteria-1 TaxID=2013768 RepID=A0A2N2E991_9BACT|nr:MAG: hypothetical protein CVU82_01805 [Candidatus Falkowbacteria bacterium HGW-Falkowbacteria-1]